MAADGQVTSPCIGPDKNPRHIRMDMQARKARGAFKNIDPSKRWHVDKGRGYVMAGWDPVLRISPNPDSAPSSLPWAGNIINKPGPPKQELSSADAAIIAPLAQRGGVRSPPSPTNASTSFTS
eukprot:5307089-Pyramimonas_sp.AAC.1